MKIGLATIARWKFVFLCLVAVCGPSYLSMAAAQESFISPADARIELVGRYDKTDPALPRLAFPGSGIRLRFQGTWIGLQVSSDSEKSALTVVIDHADPRLQLLEPGDNQILLADKLADESHTVEIYKRTETSQGILTVKGIQLPNDATLLTPLPLPARKLMFIGDSVTCGAGVNSNAECKPDSFNPANDAYDSYGMVLSRHLDAQAHLVCYGGRGLERDYRGLGIAEGVLNAPQFMELSVPSDDPAKRASWNAKNWQPEAIFISLGTNDFNLQKSKPLDEKKWVSDYLDLLKSVRADYPQAYVFLTGGAMVTNPLLGQLIQQVVDTAKDGRTLYVPGVHYPGNGCSGHPTRAQHLHMADDLEPVMRSTLGW